MADGYDELTDKEKQTLRLMVRGHDAKSAASELALSVHTINERLRDARRKLAVSSSRIPCSRQLRSSSPIIASASSSENGRACKSVGMM